MMYSRQAMEAQEASSIVPRPLTFTRYDQGHRSWSTHLARNRIPRGGNVQGVFRAVIGLTEHVTARHRS